MKTILSPKPWLVLFDIDDTLIIRRDPSVHIGLIRWVNVIQSVFSLHLEETQLMALRGRWDGWVDYQIGWDMVKAQGITRDNYDSRFPQVRDALYREATKQEKELGRMYLPGSGAAGLLEKLIHTDGITLGLLTGNMERVGRWKLRQGNLEGYFQKGWFCDTAKSRVEIAQNAMKEARDQSGNPFSPDRITVIGDTIHDIRCGRAIGAFTIGMTAGRRGAAKILINEGAVFTVHSLMDKQMLQWFKL
jgi:phosphoglycolate phosphatase